MTIGACSGESANSNTYAFNPNDLTHGFPMTEPSRTASPASAAFPLPDFTAEGYRVVQELGNNRAGGRITYRAQEFNTHRDVVIKEFQFGAAGNRWDTYDTYQREIDVLKSLDHRCIPRYIDSFQTATGFCMVQEYKPAPSLAEPRPWTVQQVRHVAIALLDILIYLQSQIPPIIHRDLKPDNVLVDEQMTVYLVDFGFARLGGGQVAVSSVVKGTLGFMPPEQLFNRELSPASDLYSLGMTLICLLTQIPATEVGLLMDDAGRVHIRDRLPFLSLQLLTWLETLTQPQVYHRYANAAAARSQLTQIAQLTRSPWPASGGRLLKFGAGLLAIAGGTIAAIAVWQSETVRPSLFWQTLRQAFVVSAAEPAWQTVDNALQTAASSSYPVAFFIASGQVSTQWQVTLARQSDTEPQEILETLPPSSSWVALVEGQSLPNGDYAAKCDLLNQNGEAIPKFSSEARILIRDQRLQLWCQYPELAAASPEVTPSTSESSAEENRDRPVQFRFQLTNPHFEAEVVHPNS